MFEPEKDLIESVSNDIVIKDDLLHTFVWLRDRVDSADPVKARVEVFSAQEIKNLLDAAPNQVNYVIFKKGRDVLLVKATWATKLRIYNVHADQTNLVSPTFAKELLTRLGKTCKSPIFDAMAGELDD